MIITWYGEGCFKVQAGEISLKTDPFEKADTGLTTPYFNADVTLRSRCSFGEEERKEMVSAVNSGVFIYSPGEYELKGITIRGVQLVNDDTEFLDTAYTIQWGDLKLGHLGHIHSIKTNPRVMEMFTDIDILFVPVSAPYLEAGDAATLVNQIAPKIAIPMYYAVKGLTRKADDVSVFLKEFGVSPEVQDKLTTKKKDIDQHEETQIVVLKAQSQT
ncbi:MAG: MBL fold metallo-hydrolase [Parcubacteria group bacterium]|nr:MBL fold metallo-hydrolase [Parcubacteria group bacterium]